MSYLGQTAEEAEDPGRAKHPLRPSPGAVPGQRVHDGDVAVQRDGDQQKGGQVEAEGPEEHADPAGDVPGLPGHRGVPDGLQRHEDEGHDQVRYGQVHNEDVDTGFEPLGSEEGDEDGEVAGGSHDEEARIGDDGHERVLRKPHLLGEGPAHVAHAHHDA